MSLRELLDAATPGPWEVNSIHPDYRLGALAPDMASLLIDMADALEASDRLCARSGLCADFPSLLARFAELEQRAAP